MKTQRCRECLRPGDEMSFRNLIKKFHVFISHFPDLKSWHAYKSLFFIYVALEERLRP